MVREITYDDVMEYSDLFTLAPAFLLEMMANTNFNLVLKFKSSVKSQFEDLTPDQREKLDVILTSDIDDLQAIMNEAYMKTNKKQYAILANPKHKKFIEKNLSELRKLIS